MNGIQRFFLCVLSLLAIMICFPNYDGSIVSFALISMGICFGGLFVLSMLVGLLGLDKYPTFNKLLTLAVWIVFTLYLLFNFPQMDKVSPINKLKHGDFPKKQDILDGAQKLTFHVNMVRTKEQIEEQQHKNKYRNREEQIMNPEGTAPSAQPQPQPKPKTKPKPKEEPKVEIFMEDEEGYVDAQFMPEN
jgi:hypothetical protein